MLEQNLTGFIAANVTLIQPWYAIMLGTLSGVLSAGIGALAVYLATIRAQKREDIKKLIEGRKGVYLDFILYGSLIGNGSSDQNDKNRFTKSVFDIMVLGSPEVIAKLRGANLQQNDQKKMKRAIGSLIPIMARELQGEDIYEIVDQIMKSAGNSSEKSEV